jgi:hypothetical protein
LYLLRLISAADLLKTQQPVKYFLKFLVFLVLLTACEGEGIERRQNGSAYFPLQKGIFQVYSVHEIRYHVGESPLALNYEIRAEVTDSFPSGVGQYTYVIHRSIRETEADAWQPLDTWSVRKDEQAVVVAEGNTAYVKIRFPLSGEQMWDGNMFNAIGPDDYSFRDLELPAEVNGMTFERTITIEQERNEDRIVFRDERTEVYAAEVGLVFKEFIQLNYCTADACLGQQKVDHGTEMQMLIKEYGKR